MGELVSSHEFLRIQGNTFVVFHPQGEQLVLGLGSSETPVVVPHCVAYRRNKHYDQGHNRSQHGSEQPWPSEAAFDALQQVHRILHLQAPPTPPTLQQRQDQQPSSQQSDILAAAKAGLIRQKQVPEGSDGFIWLDRQQQEKLLQRQQQQRKQQAAQQQVQQQLSKQPELAKQQLPVFAGGQVPALWPPDDYEAMWLMTPDNHIAGLDTTPQHILLDRFEATWGWALQQLGFTQARCRNLSAVLAVPIDMTAAEVRMLADLILGRLGFAALVVHLEPVAACFGNGTTSACIINAGSSCCTVCCVDDAVVLPPTTSRYTLPLGLVDMAAALTGWMACYGHWPVQLLQQGIGVGSSSGTQSSGNGSPGGQQTDDTAGAAAAAAGAGGSGGRMACSRQGGTVSPASIYGLLLLEDLVLQQCYFPKENYQPGLLGQPMLEDQRPAVVPIRTPGQPTTNYVVSLGSWAAAAAMTLLHPALAPPAASTVAGDPAQQPNSGAAGQIRSLVKQEQPDHTSSLQDAQAAATPTAPSTPAAPTEHGSNAEEARSDWLYRRYHASTVEVPAAEALHFQSQLRVRLEAGDTAPPPDGMYLLPMELTDKPAAAGAGAVSGTPGVETPEVKPAVIAAAGGGRAGGSTPAGAPSMGLDEAVFRSILATSAGRPELMSRLAAGLLLIGPGGGLRGLGSMLERRVGQRFSKARQPQVVSTLEPRAEPAHVTWKGAALLAALDSGRENWLPRHQWVDGGMVLPAPAAKGPSKGSAGAAAMPKKAAGAAAAAVLGGGAAGSGGAAAGSGSNSVAAAGRHTKLFYYCRAEQGML